VVCLFYLNQLSQSGRLNTQNPLSRVDSVHYLLKGANRSPHEGHSMATATALVNHLILHNVPAV
jgi:hypothetical protein